MPGLVRKFVVFAAIDGLILQPVAPKGQRAPPSTKIDYKDNVISTTTNTSLGSESSRQSFEAFGIVGKVERQH